MVTLNQMIWASHLGELIQFANKFLPNRSEQSETLTTCGYPEPYLRSYGKRHQQFATGLVRLSAHTTNPHAEQEGQPNSVSH